MVLLSGHRVHHPAQSPPPPRAHRPRAGNVSEQLHKGGGLVLAPLVPAVHYLRGGMAGGSGAETACARPPHTKPGVLAALEICSAAVQHLPARQQVLSPCTWTSEYAASIFNARLICGAHARLPHPVLAAPAARPARSPPGVLPCTVLPPPPPSCPAAVRMQRIFTGGHVRHCRRRRQVGGSL